jgi:hypothetical protein
MCKYRKSLELLHDKYLRNRSGQMQGQQRMRQPLWALRGSWRQVCVRQRPDSIRRTCFTGSKPVKGAVLLWRPAGNIVGTRPLFMRQVSACKRDSRSHS